MSDIDTGAELDYECDIESGHIAWMLISIALVFIQTPAVGITQAGMIRRKNSLSMLMQCFAGMILGALLWFCVGYSLVFAPTMNGIIGNFNHMFLLDVPIDDCVRWAPNIPGSVFATYQMMFAMMVPTLVTGAVAEKMTFQSFMLLAFLWPICVYYPIAHTIWGDGFLAQWGVLDFAGGFVVHLTAGVASFVISIMIPNRVDIEEMESQHHNLPLTFVGGALIWFGWFSFNGGGGFAADKTAGLAVINTQLSASCGAASWFLCAWYDTDMFHLTEILNGSFAGLAGVTAAAGFIHPWSAALCGLIAGPLSYYTSLAVKEFLHIDDVLDVTSLQGTPGLTGGVFGVGLFASSAMNSAVKDEGLIYGTGVQIGKQLVAALFTTVWTAVGTAICMYIVNHFGKQLTEEEYYLGLDITEQGLTGYDNLSLAELLGRFVDFASKGYIMGLKRVMKAGLNVDESDYDGRTALHLAASEGHLESVKFLVAEGAHVNCEDRWGGTPLSDAMKNEQKQVVDWLKEHGAELKEHDFATELCDAGHKGDVDALKKLETLGIDLNSADYDGRTAMHLAAAEGHFRCVKFLIESSCNPNVQDRWGFTPFGEAEMNRHNDVVELLISSGSATVAEKLCRAAERGDLRTIKRLVQAGCDLNIGDYDKRTAMHLAAAAGHMDVIRYLDQKGAEQTADRFGNKPITDAKRHKHQEIVRYLFLAGKEDKDHHRAPRQNRISLSLSSTNSVSYHSKVNSNLENERAPSYSSNHGLIINETELRSVESSSFANSQTPLLNNAKDGKTQ